MKLTAAKAIALLVTSTVLFGCNGSGYADNSTYGIPNDKWSAMSYDQQEAAREVFRLDEAKREEQRKLNVMREEKAQRDAQREILRQDELNAMEREEAALRVQKSKVETARQKEAAKQRKREQELDALKGTTLRPAN